MAYRRESVFRIARDEKRSRGPWKPYAAAVLCVLMIVMTAPAQAEDARQPAWQLVLFETRDCLYCRLFDRHVTPAYLASPWQRRAPLKRVNLFRQGSGGYGLSAPITVLPTVVLFRDGREVGRITGFTGKPRFFQLVRHLLGEAGRL